MDAASLDAEVAALVAAARDVDAHYEAIPDLAWPEGVRIAVNFTLDFDAMLLRRLKNEPPMQLAKGEFGGRVGIWRAVELFSRLGVKATIFTVGRICELYPEALRNILAQGHEIADHMWEHHVPKDPAMEEDHFMKTIAAFRDTLNLRAVGSRSRHSNRLLAREGFLYNSHGSAAHGPHYTHDGAGHCVLNLPFHYAIDDAMFYSANWQGSELLANRFSDTDRVEEIWWQGFLQQYRVGGYLNVCLHPFVSGRAQRIDMLERLVQRMQAMPGVWMPTCADVARHVVATRPSLRVSR
jgi:peptidoglycan/xylan/chitin deacetylase (PgdA/CDA1 family)